MLTTDLPTLPPGLDSWDQPMRQALAEAHSAAQAGEVPVGAVLLGPDGAVLARAANAPIANGDPTAHAEILAMRQAARRLGNYRLTGCTLVVTLEPCLMCLGAMVHARIGALVYGAHDPKSGAVASRLDAASLDFVNHRFPALGGVLAQECGDVLRRFFRARRQAATPPPAPPGSHGSEST